MEIDATYKLDRAGRALGWDDAELWQTLENRNYWHDQAALRVPDDSIDQWRHSR